MAEILLLILLNIISDMRHTDKKRDPHSILRLRLPKAANINSIGETISRILFIRNYIDSIISKDISLPVYSSQLGV